MGHLTPRAKLQSTPHNGERSERSVTVLCQLQRSLDSLIERRYSHILTRECCNDARFEVRLTLRRCQIVVLGLDRSVLSPVHSNHRPGIRRTRRA